MAPIAVTSLHVYPVKSAGGMSVARATVSDRGFEHDRRFMLTDEHGRFISQREQPRLALCAVTVEEEQLRLTAPGMAPLAVALRPRAGAARSVTVWTDCCDAISVGEAAASWFSRYLGIACELVYMPDASLRITDAGYGPTSRVGFADGYPFLLVSEASLAELARHGSDVPMDRFRPNIVVAGCAPFAEDGWRRARIGGVLFHLVKPCARCPITTIDQATATAGKEPLRTLASFRRDGNKVLFAMNMTHEGTGELRVGDQVTVEE